MSHGFSGGKQMIKCANTRNSVQVSFTKQQKRKALNLILKMKTANYGWKQSFGLH